MGKPQLLPEVALRCKETEMGDGEAQLHKLLSFNSVCPSSTLPLLYGVYILEHIQLLSDS